MTNEQTLKPTLEDAFKEIDQYPLTDAFLTEAYDMVSEEHAQAILKFPRWPVSIFVGQTIIGEEVGEAEQAALDIPFDLAKGNGSVANLLKEHAQAAAMHVRQIQHILVCARNSEVENNG